MSVRSPKAVSPPSVSLKTTDQGGSSSKTYPKSARHAKGQSGITRPKKGDGAKGKSKGTESLVKNIKPSSTRSSKYRQNKRIRSHTTADEFEDDTGDNGDNDEKAFFGQTLSNVSNKSNKSNKGGKSKKSKKSDLDEFGLPEFIIDHSNDALMNREMTGYEMRNKSKLKEIEATFESFEKLLSQRKLDCIDYARKAFDKSQFITVYVDIDGTNEFISQIGTKLGEKEFELGKEQTLCIDKLREIIYFEDHSTEASAKLKELQKTLEIEKSKIEEDKAKVKAELAKVEPKLAAARAAVSGIPKSSLDEFRALRKPSPILIDVVKAVAILVGKKEKELDSWNNVRRLLDSKFIDHLLNFDAKNLTSKARKIIEVKYLQRADFTFERINQASTVAGPFVFWLASQIDYARLLDEVSPIQNEVDRLQEELTLNENKAKMLENMLVELAKRVKQCRYEMMEMVRKIVKLQDDIKEARNAHAQ